MSIGPRQRHLLDQTMAFHLEVQGKLKQFERDLIELGYSKPEAWALARNLEERILGPVLDHASRTLPLEQTVDEAIRRRLEELGE